MVEILGDSATSAEVREVEANARDLVALVRSPSARSKGGRGGGTEEESGARERDGPAALLVSRAGQRGAGGRTTIDSILGALRLRREVVFYNFGLNFVQFRLQSTVLQQRGSEESAGRGDDEIGEFVEEIFLDDQESFADRAT